MFVPHSAGISSYSPSEPSLVVTNEILHWEKIEATQFLRLAVTSGRHARHPLLLLVQRRPKFLTVAMPQEPIDAILQLVNRGVAGPVETQVI